VDEHLRGLHESGFYAVGYANVAVLISGKFSVSIR